MGTYCATLVAELFLFCYEWHVVLSFSENKHADVIEALNSTSNYLVDLLNSDNPYFKQDGIQMYSNKLHLNKVNAFDTDSPYWGLGIFHNEWHSFI